MKENNNVYKIKTGTYDDYIKWNGLRCVQTPGALELKDNNAKLYLIFKDDEYETDFLVYSKEDNLATIANSRIMYDCFNEVLDYLKNEYEYITLILPEEDEKQNNIVKDNCKIVKETELEQSGFDGTVWKYIKYKIQLKNNK